jgi:hypothetical protein
LLHWKVRLAYIAVVAAAVAALGGDIRGLWF